MESTAGERAPMRSGWWWRTTLAGSRQGEYAALALILGLALFLRTFRLNETGQNLYYAAGARSMLDSWHNLFYVSFDPSGALMIDKPPLGFWLQAGSARLLGFHYWALAVPQVIAGVAAVFALFVIVRGQFGQRVALLAALALALMPASVASARNNSLDTLTMLFMLLAAGAVIRARRDGEFRWLAGAAVLAGLAFNTKMFVAFIPLPVFLIFYACGRPWRTRPELAKLAGAAAILIVVSLAWVCAVAATPRADRPHIYNGYGDSIWGLTFRYNGVNRLIGNVHQDRVRSSTEDPEAVTLATASLGARPGLGRLLRSPFGSQVGWFMLPAAVGGLAALRRRHQRADALLWAGWFVLGWLVFSVGKDVKSQYLEAMAAPLAVCSALGLAWTWENARHHPQTVAATVTAITAYATYLLLSADDTWSVGFAIAAAGAVTALLVLSFARRAPSEMGPRVLRTITVLSGAVLFAGPLSWSLATAILPATGSAARYTIAGPDDVREYPPTPGGDLPTEGDVSTEDPVLALLQTQPSATKYLVLTERALFGNAARYIVLANRPVLTLDSFATEREAVATLAPLVARGELRYAELPPDGPWSKPASPLGAWFMAHCQDVTTGRLQPLGAYAHLYDCAPG